MKLTQPQQTAATNLLHLHYDIMHTSWSVLKTRHHQTELDTIHQTLTTAHAKHYDENQTDPDIIIHDLTVDDLLHDALDDWYLKQLDHIINPAKEPTP